MAEVAKTASRAMAAFVADSTGVTGTFDYVIHTSITEITRFGLRPLPPEALAGLDDRFPTFETAIQEQLGLKLERSEDFVPVLLMDSVQQPTEN